MAVILVTGGAGYVGSHACKALAMAGHQPVVFDNFVTGFRAAVRYGERVEGDLLDPNALDRAFEQHRPDGVMHFAALSTVGESSKEPELYWRNNVTGTLNLISAMRRHGLDKLVFSSTCAIYGDVETDVITEANLHQPINPYARTKLAVEEMLRDFHGAYGLKHVIFRYFNAAGADPDREIGEAHDPETHLIPLTLDAISGRRDNIKIFGTDYPTPDGTCIRDYIHVMDLARAHVLGIERLLDGGASIALNLGSGSGFSVRQVLDTAAKVTGMPVPQVPAERRDGDPTRLVSGSDLARTELGWELERSDLETIILDAWAWHQTGKFRTLAPAE